MSNDSPGAAPVKHSVKEADEIPAWLAEESLDLGYCEADRAAFERASFHFAASLRVVKAMLAHNKAWDGDGSMEEVQRTEDEVDAALAEWEE